VDASCATATLAFDEPSEIAAGVVEVGVLRGPHGLGFVSKRNTLGLQALEFGGDVVSSSLGRRAVDRCVAAAWAG
jgi:hypothetical protein